MQSGQCEFDLHRSVIGHTLPVVTFHWKLLGTKYLDTVVFGTILFNNIFDNIVLDTFAHKYSENRSKDFGHIFIFEVLRLDRSNRLVTVQLITVLFIM